MECNLIINDLYDGKIAHYFAPKCGSRTIFGWSTLIKEPELLEIHPEWFNFSRKEQYREIRDRITYGKLPLNIKECAIRICVVRDPVERFISAYTNRILFLNTTGKYIPISEFINTIDDLDRKEMYKDVKLHMRPLVDWYGMDTSVFTDIYNLKDILEIKKLLEKFSGKSLPYLHLHKNEGIEKPRLTDNEIEFLKNRYKQDYEIYGKWM